MKHDYGTENNLNLKLLVVMARASQVLEKKLIPDIRKTGLTLPQFGVLEALYHKGPLTVNEIIEKRLSSSGNIAVVVDNLAQLGFAEKTIGKKDKRFRLISLTEPGRELIRQFFPNHMKVLAQAVNNLTRDDKKELIRLLKKLGKNQEGK